MKHVIQDSIPHVVHVVAWSFDSGGGFEWYYDKEPAEIGWQKEKDNANDRQLAKEGWTAYRFEYRPVARTAQGVTQEIDAKLPDLCRQSAERYRLPTPDMRLDVPTYYSDRRVDFAAPFVPVLVNEADGMRVLLGTDDRDAMCADIQIERRPGGWTIFLHPMPGSDPSGYVHFLDDGRSFLVAESGLGPTPAIQVVDAAPNESAVPTLGSPRRLSTAWRVGNSSRSAPSATRWPCAARRVPAGPPRSASSGWRFPNMAGFTSIPHRFPCAS